MTADTAMREASRRLGATLLFFDLETTGTNAATDRIVEIAVAKVTPGEVIRRSRLVNPGCPIPPAATAIHGITDEMVAGERPFAHFARALRDFIEGGVFVAFNGLRFDLPLLAAEFDRAAVEFDPETFAVIDPFVVFSRQEPRDLSAALRFYCGEDHNEAHRGDADIDATAKVLVAQLDRYALPENAVSLAEWCHPPDAVDRGGWFVWREAVAVITRGKHSGTPLDRLDRDYLRWMSRLPDLPTSTRRIVADAIRGQYPRKPEK